MTSINYGTPPGGAIFYNNLCVKLYNIVDKFNNVVYNNFKVKEVEEQAMSKSMYSLILSDKVIEAVDKMAYSVGTSRSNLINQILAEYFSYTTPEKTMKDIFEQLIQIMNLDETFKIQHQPSDAMLSIRSPLKVRYNPTIKYLVELYGKPNGAVGELRVITRTQSASLSQTLNDFFTVFVRIEAICLNQLIDKSYQPIAQVSEGRMARKLYLSRARDCCCTDEIGKGIADYIRTMDSCLKIYLSQADQPEIALRDIKKMYFDYIEKGALII